MTKSMRYMQTSRCEYVGYDTCKKYVRKGTSMML